MDRGGNLKSSMMVKLLVAKSEELMHGSGGFRGVQNSEMNTCISIIQHKNNSLCISYHSLCAQLTLFTCKNFNSSLLELIENS